MNDPNVPRLPSGDELEPGYVICPECSGTGVCVGCGGEGTTARGDRCFICIGSGWCPLCRGGGQVPNVISTP